MVSPQEILQQVQVYFVTTEILVVPQQINPMEPVEPIVEMDISPVLILRVLQRPRPQQLQGIVIRGTLPVVMEVLPMEPSVPSSTEMGNGLEPVPQQTLLERVITEISLVPMAVQPMVPVPPNVEMDTSRVLIRLVPQRPRQPQQPVIVIREILPVVMAHTRMEV